MKLEDEDTRSFNVCQQFVFNFECYYKPSNAVSMKVLHNLKEVSISVDQSKVLFNYFFQIRIAFVGFLKQNCSCVKNCCQHLNKIDNLLYRERILTSLTLKMPIMSEISVSIKAKTTDRKRKKKREVITKCDLKLRSRHITSLSYRVLHGCIFEKC